MIRSRGIPYSRNIRLICPASVLPLRGFPPVTMIGACGNICATAKPVRTRVCWTNRMVPSGLSP
jgi:hypothetical protein